jgi:hypothetical protein
VSLFYLFLKHCFKQFYYKPQIAAAAAAAAAAATATAPSPHRHPAAPPPRRFFS